MSGFIGYALAAGFVLLSVVLTEQWSLKAGWLLAIILILGTFLARPQVVTDLTRIVRG